MALPNALPIHPSALGTPFRQPGFVTQGICLVRPERRWVLRCWGYEPNAALLAMGLAPGSKRLKVVAYQRFPPGSRIAGTRRA